MNLTILILGALADLITIAGVAFAIFTYFRLKHNYVAQKAYEYALDILEKTKLLHYSIEQLRVSELYNLDPNDAKEILEKTYMPKIESLNREAVTIRSRLLIVENSLRKHKDLLQRFNALIIRDIMNEIENKVTTFYLEENKRGISFPIHFPAEFRAGCETKKSSLDTEETIVDDDFNKTIEKNFNIIYKCLKEELSLK